MDTPLYTNPNGPTMGRIEPASVTRPGPFLPPATKASEWISVADKLHPDKPGLNDYERVLCLVAYRGEILLRQWNCEHEVWDDEDGDDYFCRADEVSHWMPVPPVPRIDNGGLVKMWLDDIRDPDRYGHIGWTWVKTAEEAISLLKTGRVEQASLDHDLTVEQTMGRDDGKPTGFTVAEWMESTGTWPPRGTDCHSLNKRGSTRINELLRRNGQSTTAGVEIPRLVLRPPWRGPRTIGWLTGSLPAWGAGRRPKRGVEDVEEQ